jgi:hypothetical protein
MLARERGWKQRGMDVETYKIRRIVTRQRQSQIAVASADSPCKSVFDGPASAEGLRKITQISEDVGGFQLCTRVRVAPVKSDISIER